MKRFLLTAAAICALTISPVFAAAEGTAVGVNPDARAQSGAADRVLQVGSDVSLGERIVTGPSGQVQIVFADQTRLVVGPSSALLIESYLMSGTSADKFAINALGGTFRFISGTGPKSAYSIRTPTASIAVRGTKFDVLVGRSQTQVLLFDGAVRLCSTAGLCAELAERCDLGVTSSSGASRIAHADPEHRPLSMEFRYARFQSPLLRDFRISGASQCTTDRPDQTPPFAYGSDNGDNGPDNSGTPTDTNTDTDTGTGTDTPVVTDTGTETSGEDTIDTVTTDPTSPDGTTGTGGTDTGNPTDTETTTPGGGTTGGTTGTTGGTTGGTTTGGNQGQTTGGPSNTTGI